MAQPRLRVAIFECDHSLDPDRTLYGGYGGLILSWCQQSPLLRQSADISIWDVERSSEYLHAGPFDAIIISGSPTSVVDEEPWVKQLLHCLQEILSRKSSKVVGLCFGHQIMAKALGLRVEKSDRGFETSNTHIQLSSGGQKLFGKPSMCLRQMHSDNVMECADAVQNLGWTDFCAVQGLYIPNVLLSVQAHPEFDAAVMEKVLLLMQAAGALRPEEYEDARLRNVSPTDSDIVLDAIARFVWQG